MIPDNWDKSYNAIQLGINLEETNPDKIPDKDSDIKWNIKAQKIKRVENIQIIKV